MSDGLPTDERLRRIERGVQQRIDARRQIGRRLAGAAVAVALLAGGVALVRPVLGTSAASSAGGSSGGGSYSANSAELVPVLCHSGSTTRQVRAARDGLPASAIAACTTLDRASTTKAEPGALASASPSPAPTPALCAAASGALHVYLDGSSCAAHDQRRTAG